MVDFNTRIFNEDDGKIIGAEITVISTSGDNLGSISVANAETLAEMQAQLAVIDETYFTEERLEAILSNINESQEINATTLSGFLSSDFAKVNQLSNYAPLSHNHNVSQITGLYDYQITASEYNVNIDGSVTIIVKVKNKATGQPVVGVTVPVLKNNANWQSGTTGVNGTFSLTYTADTWGLITFTAENVSTQINVIGMKQITNAISSPLTYTLFVDKSIRAAQLKVSGQNISIGSGKSHFEVSGFVPEEYRPKSSVFSSVSRTQYLLAYLWINGTVGLSNFYSSTLTNQTAEALLSWNY